MKEATPNGEMLNKILTFYAIMLLMSITFFAAANNASTNNSYYSHSSSFLSSGDGENKIHSASWQQLISNTEIEIKYRYAECELPANGSHYENVYLQITNKTNREIKIEWNGENWYNDKCNGCEPGKTENHRTIFLKAGQTIEGSCSSTCDPALMIVSKMLHRKASAELTNFNLRDLTVLPIQK